MAEENREELLATDGKLWTAHTKLDDEQKKLVERLDGMDKALTKTSSLFKDEMKETTKMA